MSTEHDTPTEPVEEAARKIGAEHGAAAATWYDLDSTEAAENVLTDEEDGDLEGAIPAHALADLSTDEAVDALWEIYNEAGMGAEAGDEDNLPPPLTDSQTDAYVDAFADSYTSAIVTRARAYLSGSPVPVYVEVDGESVESSYSPDVETVAVSINEDAQHNAARALAWANSARIHLNPEDDSITVTISTGDPRGAFAMTIRRVPADATDVDGSPHENAGRLIMHVPDPSDGMLHESLTPLHPGTFFVGEGSR